MLHKSQILSSYLNPVPDAVLGGGADGGGDEELPAGRLQGGHRDLERPAARGQYHHPTSTDRLEIRGWVQLWQQIFSDKSQISTNTLWVSQYP